MRLIFGLWSELGTKGVIENASRPALFAFVEKNGGSRGQILHVAQSQYHDIGISRKLGLTNCWIQRRHAQPGYGGTIEPERFTEPDFHFTSMGALADAVEASLVA